VTSQVGSPPEKLSAVTIHAPAKINLILRILDRRPDGYHNLWSIMHTVGLEDELLIKLAAPTDGIRLTCNAQTLAVDQSNLVYKAASAILDRTQQSVGLDIELRKRIPMGAGLGGGSSDAAATIIGLNHLLQLGWSRDRMAEVGQSLGSDIPFFLFSPSAVVACRGEAVTPMTIEGRRWVLLVKPGFGVETKWAYQELAATRGAVRPLSAGHVELDQRKAISCMGCFARSNRPYRRKAQNSRCFPGAARRYLDCFVTNQLRATRRRSLRVTNDWMSLLYQPVPGRSPSHLDQLLIGQLVDKLPHIPLQFKPLVGFLNSVQRTR
jgi:4-diphosphocytidyl-2-C-methyl-D-erythritol kinase